MQTTDPLKKALAADAADEKIKRVEAELKSANLVIEQRQKEIAKLAEDLAKAQTDAETLETIRDQLGSEAIRLIRERDAMQRLADSYRKTSEALNELIVLERKGRN